jgi:hypothetical protein
MATYEDYADAFPDAEMFDSRSMAGEDFDRLEELMEIALERGSAITKDDLLFPVPDPEPDQGLVF